MKKIIKLILLVLPFLCITDVFAYLPQETGEIIRGAQDETLICSWQIVKDKNSKYRRVSIYYNDQTGNWSIYWDTDREKDQVKDATNQPKSKTGSFEYVFSKDGKNVNGSQNIFDEIRLGNCPQTVSVDGDGLTRRVYLGQNDNKKETCQLTFNYKNQDVDSFGRVYYTTEKSDLEAKTTTDIDNQNVGDNFCYESGTLKALKLVGIFIFLAKCVAPLIIIVMGSFDLFKAVVNSDPEKALAKQAKGLLIRVLIGVSVFFLPSLIGFFVEATGLLPNEYQRCEKCVLDPWGSCK